MAPDIGELKLFATALKMGSTFMSIDKQAQKWIEQDYEGVVWKDLNPKDLEEEAKREWYDLHDAWERANKDLRGKLQRFEADPYSRGASPILRYERFVDSMGVKAKLFLGLNSHQAKGYRIVELDYPRWLEELMQTDPDVFRSEKLTEGEVYALVPSRGIDQEKLSVLNSDFFEELEKLGVPAFDTFKGYKELKPEFISRFQKTIDTRLPFDANVLRVQALEEAIKREHALAVPAPPGRLAVGPPSSPFKVVLPVAPAPVRPTPKFANNQEVIYKGSKYLILDSAFQNGVWLYELNAPGVSLFRPENEISTQITTPQLQKYEIYEDGHRAYTTSSEKTAQEVRDKVGRWANRNFTLKAIPVPKTLIINDFTAFDNFRDLFPVGSYAVDVESQYIVNGKWVEQRKKPLYHVIQVTEGTHFHPSGEAGSAYGKVVDTFQAFNEKDNEIYKQKAIARAEELNHRTKPEPIKTIARAPTALMDVDVRTRTHLKLNVEEAQKSYKEFGEWYENVFEPAVPIEQITLPSPWAPPRLKDNLEKIASTGSMPPVFLSYDEKTQKYDVADGIHRINAAKQLGYIAVPAVVEYRRTYPPKIKTVSTPLYTTADVTPKYEMPAYFKDRAHDYFLISAKNYQLKDVAKYEDEFNKTYDSTKTFEQNVPAIDAMLERIYQQEKPAMDEEKENAVLDAIKKELRSKGGSHGDILWLDAKVNGQRVGTYEEVQAITKRLIAKGLVTEFAPGLYRLPTAAPPAVAPQKFKVGDRVLWKGKAYKIEMTEIFDGVFRYRFFTDEGYAMAREEDLQPAPAVAEIVTPEEAKEEAKLEKESEEEIEDTREMEKEMEAEETAPLTEEQPAPTPIVPLEKPAVVTKPTVSTPSTAPAAPAPRPTRILSSEDMRLLQDYWNTQFIRAIGKVPAGFSSVFRIEFQEVKTLPFAEAKNAILAAADREIGRIEQEQRARAVVRQGERISPLQPLKRAPSRGREIVEGGEEGEERLPMAVGRAPPSFFPPNALSVEQPFPRGPTSLEQLRLWQVFCFEMQTEGYDCNQYAREFTEYINKTQFYDWEDLKKNFEFFVDTVMEGATLPPLVQWRKELTVPKGIGGELRELEPSPEPAKLTTAQIEMEERNAVKRQRILIAQKAAALISYNGYYPGRKQKTLHDLYDEMVSRGVIDRSIPEEIFTPVAKEAIREIYHEPLYTEEWIPIDGEEEFTEKLNIGRSAFGKMTERQVEAFLAT